jgi:hypothetical protein
MLKLVSSSKVLFTATFIVNISGGYECLLVTVLESVD